MKYYACVLPNPYHETLIYASPLPIALGSQVCVPYGMKERCAWVWSEVAVDALPKVPIRSIIRVSSAAMLSAAWREWTEWVCRYYHYKLVDWAAQNWPRFLWMPMPELPEAYLQAYPGQVGDYCVPGGILVQEKLWTWHDLHRAGSSDLELSPYADCPFALSESQRAACAAIPTEGFKICVLEGPTGSGKTEVYLERASACAQMGPVLLLLPEIALTEHMMTRLKERLGYAPWVYHSRLAPKLRQFHWMAAAQQAKGLWVGTRSALFLPASWRMVCMDEEHDSSYVQSQGFYYTAKHALLMRAKQSHTPVVLGSATLSMESLYHARQGRYTHLKLEKPYHAPLAVHVQDARLEPVIKGMALSLWQALDRHLARGQQVLVFLNRRGYAPVLFCKTCGWKKICPDCDTHMVVHRQTDALRCHHCDHAEPIPKLCAEGHDTLSNIGVGTQRLEEAIAERYPEYVLRMDQDSDRAAHERLEKVLVSGTPAVIIGTQMIAKGFDAAALRCVLIVDLDYALCRTAYRADEEVYQLLTQVMGRAARRQRAADDPNDELWVQTYMPEHVLWSYLREQRLESYPDQLLLWRKEQGLPPYTYVCRLRLSSKKEETLVASVAAIKSQFSCPGVVCYGPWPSAVRRTRNLYHYWGMLVAQERRGIDAAMYWMEGFLPTLKGVTWRLDRDAQDASG